MDTKTTKTQKKPIMRAFFQGKQFEALDGLPLIDRYTGPQLVQLANEGAFRGADMVEFHRGKWWIVTGKRRELEGLCRTRGSLLGPKNEAAFNRFNNNK